MMAICHSKVQKLLNGNILTNLSNTHVSYFLYSLWSVKIHAVIQTSKETDRVCIIGFGFLHTKQRIYKCNEPGTTSKTNGTAKQKKQSKQLLREYRKANTWYSWFLWLWQSSSRWENNSRPEKTSPVKPCRCQDKCWMSELERKREGVWALEWLL